MIAPVIINSGNRYDDRRSGSGGPGGPGGPSGCSGCLRTFLMMILVIILLSAIVSCMATDIASPGYESGNYAEIGASSCEREKLDIDSTVDAGWFDDRAGWIDSRRTLESGLKEFYDRTGVMPYLVITDNINGDRDPSDLDAEIFCEELYDELFTARDGSIDETHLLVVFFEPYDSQYSYYIMAGSAAKSVMDEEARGILGDYIDRYYTDSSLDDSEYFAKVFEMTADRIMEVTKPAWYLPVIVISIVGAVCVIFLIWKRAMDKKIEKEKADAAILNTPLQTYSEAGTTASAEDLAGKYQ